MGMNKLKIIALYDENCSLCQETKRIFTSLDVWKKVNWISLQEYEKLDSTLTFNHKELRQELHIILPNQKVLRGYDAVRKLLFISPYTCVAGSILYFPFLRILGQPVYQWVAKNRYKFLKRKCNDGSCSL
jgi:predicted DCC family thiol-disulfide oxidoreductase YuxK